MWTWNPFKAHRDHQLRLAVLQVEAAKFQSDALTQIGAQHAASLVKVGEMVTSLAEGNQQSTEVLKTWLEGFKVTADPISTTVREEDEVRMARERVLAEAGVDPNLPPEYALAEFLKANLD